MWIWRIVFRVMPVIGHFLGILIIFVVYLFRSPVLMVSDASLSLLYGASRAQAKQLEISMKTFRPFVLVTVAENAPVEIVVEAIKAGHNAPRAVLFPYYFIDAARRFHEEVPGIPALVLGGRHTGDIEGEPAFLRTDNEADFYRAGAIAAFLSREAEEGDIVLFYDVAFGDEEQAAFEKGLEEGNFSGEKIYLSAGSDYYSWQNVFCVVVAGPAARFFDRALDKPVVLFSWIDPGMTPRNVKVLFDDSPWARASESLRILNRGGGKLPSELILPSGRLAKDRAAVRKLAKTPLR